MNEKIIENFLSLCAIPHKSHHEEKISQFLYDWAMKKGLAAVRDEEGNVIIDKPGSAGHEDTPRTILQAHMDMVCEKNNDVDFAYRWAERVIVFCHGQIIADDTPLAVFKQEDILKQANLKHPMMFDVYDILKEKGIVPKGDVYPKNANGNEDYGWIAVPLPTNNASNDKAEWKMGNKYIYTLNLSEGCGKVDPVDPNPEGGGKVEPNGTTDPKPGANIFGKPIKFTVTLAPWTPNPADGNGTNIKM